MSKDKNWVGKLLAEGTSDTVSSKRLCMLLSMFVFIILAFMSAMGYSCSPEFVYIFGGLILGESGLTTTEKIKKIHHRHYNNSGETYNNEEIGDF